jgi:hypothetical protein
VIDRDRADGDLGLGLEHVPDAFGLVVEIVSLGGGQQGEGSTVIVSVRPTR